MTIFSNKRVIKILEILMDSQKSISGERISVELGVTSRTVRSDIKELNENLNRNGAKVISVTGVGYSLEIENEGKFNCFLKEVKLVKQGNSKQLNIIPTHSEDRINYIISKLLMNSLKDKNRLINPYDLCEELFISSSTLKKDVASINTHLARFYLKVVINQSKGIFIKGKESNIRYCIADYIFNKREIVNLDNIEFYNEIFSRNLLEITESVLLSVLTEYNVHLTDISFKNLLVHVLIMIKRYKYNQAVLFDNASVDFLKNTKDYLIAKEIVEKIGEVAKVDFRDEIYYLTQHLVSSKKFSNQDDSIYFEYKGAIDKILEAIKSQIGVNLLDDLQLVNGLAVHLNVALNRMKFNMNIRNDFLDSIKNSYPFAFELGIIASNVIRKEYNVSVNENEIGLLAIHFGAALERIGINSKKSVKNVTIVCGFGIATAMLIKEKILRFFDNRVNILNISSLYDFDKVMLDNSDVVITTVPITKFQSSKIIEVPLNFGFKYLQEIEDIMLGEEKIEMDYKEILKEDLFFKQLKASTKDEVLEILTSRMIELGYMNEKVKESVYSRERMSTTELGNLVALPHILELNGNSASVSVAVLDKPVTWDKEKVQIVLLLNISKEFINEWEQIFKNLYNYLIVKSGVNKLIKGISYTEFINDLIENNAVNSET
ncbi:BglG family transcription antiterminator [Terrisporobacter petrolearius]|uniref:BglG family transcription antiterminator n=1 Tax=Terrisporobacter petrolearius TaxID=1460447 RepID=UPI0031CCA2D2